MGWIKIIIHMRRWLDGLEVEAVNNNIAGQLFFFAAHRPVNSRLSDGRKLMKVCRTRVCGSAVGTCGSGLLSDA